MRLHKNVISTIAISFLLISCGDDDNDSGLDFIDQPLQGTINGKNWQAASGIAEPSSFENDQMSIQISDLQIDDICNEFFLEGFLVFFTITSEVGVYELGPNSRSITFYDFDEQLNIIVLEGTVEIQSINATAGGMVTGRIVGRSGEESFVNGNFVATWCPQ